MVSRIIKTPAEALQTNGFNLMREDQYPNLANLLEPIGYCFIGFELSENQFRNLIDLLEEDGFSYADDERVEDNNVTHVKAWYTSCYNGTVVLEYDVVRGQDGTKFILKSMEFEG